MARMNNKLFLSEQGFAEEPMKKHTRKHRAKRQMNFNMVKLCIRSLKGSPHIVYTQRPLKIKLANTAVLSHAVIAKYLASSVDLWDH